MEGSPDVMVPEIRRGLFFGGTEANRLIPTSYIKAGSIDIDGENSDGDIPYAPKNGINNRGRKLISAAFDSDDARLIELKTMGYSDAAIAKKLADEGRVIYKAQTIAGRYQRLKKVCDKAEEERLDDELSDWHLGEDDFLQNAVVMMDKKYEQEYEKLMEKKWKEISDMMAAHLQVKKYTSKACKDRWNALQDGTALKPIELDSDQEGRRIMREERVAAAKKRRADEKAAEQARANAAEDARNAKREKQRLVAEQREAERKAREAEKAETLRLRDEKIQRKQQERAGIQEAQKLWMAAINEKRRIKQMEERIYRNLTGKQLNRMRRLAPFEDAEQADEDIVLDFTGENDEEEGYITDGELDDDIEMENVPDEMEGITSDREEDACASPISSNTDVTAPSALPAPGKAIVTSETLINPRSVLTDAELEVLLFERGLARRTGRETHPQVVARIAAADEALSVAAVSALLEKHFDRSKGNKAQKVHRLAQHDADKSAAGGEGVRATDLAFKMRYEGYQGKFAGLIR